MSKLVSESASALTDESERSHNTQIQVVPLPKATAGNKVSPYRAMIRGLLQPTMSSQSSS
jgi:hypothetical protein